MTTPRRSGQGPYADLERLHVIVPLRSLATGKVRLGGAIDAEERETLLRGMLRRTLDVLAQWSVARTVHLVSTDPHLLDGATGQGPTATGQGPTATALPQLRAVLQIDEGLNSALRLGRENARAEDATALLIIPADLPYLASDALDRMLDAADAALTAGWGAPVVVIAPSDARGGTNSLLLSPIDAIEPCFGVHSLEAHVRAAAAAGASLQIVTDHRLGFDLDTPEDLELLEPSVLDELTMLGAELAPAGVARME